MGERVSPHPSRLTACHLPRRGRRPTGGGGFIGAWLSLSGVPSTPAAAAAPSPSRRGRGLPPAGAFPYLPLGEGGSAQPRRKRGGTRSDPVPPHTRQGFALPPSPRRGFFSQFVPIRSRDSLRLPSSSTAIRSRTCSTSAFMSLASHSIRVPTMACL